MSFIKATSIDLFACVVGFYLFHVMGGMLLFDLFSPDNWIWCFLQVLGLLENMSCFRCPHCGEVSYIFGSGGARRTANELDMDFIGDVCSNHFNLLCKISAVTFSKGACSMQNFNTMTRFSSFVQVKSSHNLYVTLISKLLPFAKCKWL